MTKIRLKFVREFRDQRGKLYRYVRIEGRPQVRLPGLPGSAKFMAAYAKALADAQIVIGHDFKTGSFGKLVESYYGSVEFSNLGDGRRPPTAASCRRRFSVSAPAWWPTCRTPRRARSFRRSASSTPAWPTSPAPCC
jgi:hypothetical protein